jgi:hypothetical protein
MTHAARPSSQLAQEGRVVPAIGASKRWSFAVLAAAAVFTAACRTSGGSRAPTPPVAVPPAAAVDSTPPPLPAVSFVFAGGRQQYLYSVLSEIIATTARGDTVRDSLVTSAIIAADIRDAGDQISIMGRVDSVRMRSHRRGGPALLIANGVPFSMSLQRSMPTRSALRDSAGACSATATAQGIAMAMAWRIPASLTANARWADSSTRMACIGNVVATMRSAAHYTLLERRESVDGSELRRIVRLTQSSMQNRDTLLADTSFVVTGTISGNDTLLVDLVRGRIVRASGGSQGRIQVTHGLQLEVYEQRATYQLARLSSSRR